jgi:hypothetical protein
MKLEESVPLSVLGVLAENTVISTLDNVSYIFSTFSKFCLVVLHFSSKDIQV